jgi:hypothetical protein
MGKEDGKPGDGRELFLKGSMEGKSTNQASCVD